MMKHRNISQLQKIIFLRRIIAYLLVLRYADRLTSLDNKKSDATVIATYSYTLNAVGNITQSIQEEPLEPIFTASTTNYTYNTQKTRLLSAGSDTFAYDAEGQLASGYGNTYTFDYEHRLTAISGQQSAFSFFYDGIGNRLKAIRNSVTTKYVYDIDGNVIAEADTNNAITKYYVHGLGLMSLVTPSDQVYSYHFNNIGNTIAITDSTQNIVNKYSYDPFGVILNEQETFTQPFKYVGQYGVMVEPNGFYYMLTRYMDSKAGIFTSEDTIGFAGGDANLKRYVENQPISYIDPLGLSIVSANVNVAKKGTSLIKKAYNYARSSRSWGHAQFPEEENSSMRHCVISCMVATRFGTPMGRAAGITNEMQGMIMHDIPDLWGRVSGKRQWAFQCKDLKDNERGFDAAKGNNKDMDENDIRKSCIQQCGGQ